jgi:cytochrome P450
MPDTHRSRHPILPPTVPLRWLDGRFPMLRRDRIEFLSELAKLGDVTHFRMGPYTVYFVNHPEYVRDILVVNACKFIKGRALQRTKTLLGNGLLTSEGAFHLRQRRMMQPPFHKNRIAEYAVCMTQFADEMANDWRDGETYDISQEMMRLTLRIVAKTLFATEVTSDADEVGRSLTTLVDLFNMLLLPFSEVLEKLPFPQSIRLRRARKSLDEIIYKIIDERRRDSSDHGDLLSMLLQARDEDDGGQMTDEQVRDEALTLFLAGHETTANALTWTWYLLSQNPAAEAKLHDELDRVLTPGRNVSINPRASANLDLRIPTVDDIPTLKYTECVLAESMRLFPPAWAVGRMAVETHELGGYQIPKGSTVLTSQYLLHRDPRFWDDADKFIPERWQTQSIKEAGQKNIYFPFGGGIRRCIGESFAWTEGILLIAAIARHWKLRLDPTQKVAAKPLITLRPKFGMKMSVSAR